ncbi:MAG: hypothetical protein C5B52_18760 [Bacteroidetes bacterium]|nr:MAG: hypothetical protein C5B52_18760 [Bacteroidota bacterium]
MKTKIVLISLGILAVHFTACTSITEPQLVRFDNVKVLSLGTSQSVMTLDVYCYNPNKANLKFKSADLDIYVDNHFLGHSVIDTLINIPAMDTFALPATVNLDMKNVMSNAMNLALKDSVTVKVDGVIKAGKSGFFVKRKISYEGKQPTELLRR